MYGTDVWDGSDRYISALSSCTDNSVQLLRKRPTLLAPVAKVGSLRSPTGASWGCAAGQVNATLSGRAHPGDANTSLWRSLIVGRNAGNATPYPAPEILQPQKPSPNPS